MLRLLIFLFLLLITITHNLQPALAVCPVCTVAVGAGLGLARYVGVDDIVSGIWIGGLILSSSFWLSAWLKKKNFSLPLIHDSKFIILVIVLMYAIVILPLWLSQTIGHPFNAIYGIDKLIFGIVLGSLKLLFLIF